MLKRFSYAMAVTAITGLALGMPSLATTADAGGASSSTTPFYKATKPRPQVRGSRKRVGGYSYNYEDSIIDYRDRSVFLDPRFDNSLTGPFDSGFFFDSGIERHNNSPYLY